MKSQTLNLILFRHAEAGQRLKNKSKDDLRPISASGRKECIRAAKGLLTFINTNTLILTSPIKRAEQTALILKKTILRKKPRIFHKVEIVSWLAAAPKQKTLKKFMNKISEEGKTPQSIVLVGHEPYLSKFFQLLTQSKFPKLELRKSGALLLGVSLKKKTAKVLRFSIFCPEDLITIYDYS